VDANNSVLIFKATRGAKTLKKGLTLKDAIDFVSIAQDHNRMFSDTQLMVPGVSLLVVADEYAAQVSDTGIFMVNRKEVQFQAGNY
jgi:hypothetical protein